MQPPHPPVDAAHRARTWGLPTFGTRTYGVLALLLLGLSSFWTLAPARQPTPSGSPEPSPVAVGAIPAPEPDPAPPSLSLADIGWAGQSANPAPAPAPTATAAPAGLRTHVVAPGETIRALAERYGITPQTLIAANGLQDPDLLRVGQSLVVPRVDGVVHVLQSGETIRQVAERYGVATSAVVAANAAAVGAGGDLVAAGTALVVPGARPPSPTTVRAPTPADDPPAQAVAAQPEVVSEQVAAGVEALELKPLPTAPTRVSDAPPPSVTARYVAIVDEASGELLYGRDEQARVAPASVTKIATTLVALEREPDLARRIPITISGAAMAARDGSSIMGLEPGRTVTLRTLLYGLMLPSGNDAAEQVALALAGSRPAYVAWMNQQVAELGLKDTQFANPSGMDAPGHYSSAYDMALLGRAAMRNEAFRAMAGAATYQGDSYSMRNLNRLIGTYAGADGLKIGSTPAAGKTIVASATRDGRRVYVSLMRSQDLAGDATVLFDWVWRTFRW